ncbi:MAG: hypothetical protein BWY28_01571 [bacterium ADurb.Bin236]|nr:MAG: hypothetical protein BWY28_01571 [bacterium ADurb.Bin236]HPN95520.1 hypothetical protein [bacterium]
MYKTEKITCLFICFNCFLFLTFYIATVNADVNIKDFVTVPYPKLVISEQWLSQNNDVNMPEVLLGKTVDILGYDNNKTMVIVNGKDIVEIDGILQGNFSHYESIYDFKSCGLKVNFFNEENMPREYDISESLNNLSGDGLYDLKAILLNLDGYLDEDAPDYYREYLLLSFIREIERQEALVARSEYDDRQIAVKSICDFYNRVLINKDADKNILDDISQHTNYNDMLYDFLALSNNADIAFHDFPFQELLRRAKGKHLYVPSDGWFGYCIKLDATTILLDIIGSFKMRAGNIQGSMDDFEKMALFGHETDYCDIQNCHWGTMPAGAKGLMNQYEVYENYRYSETENKWIPARDYASQILVSKQLLKDFGDDTHECGPDDCSFIRDIANGYIVKTLESKHSEDWENNLKYMINNTNDEESKYELWFTLIDKHKGSNNYKKAKDNLREIIGFDKDAMQGPLYCIGEGMCGCAYFRLKAYYYLIEQSKNIGLYSVQANDVRNLIRDYGDEIDYYDDKVKYWDYIDDFNCSLDYYKSHHQSVKNMFHIE